VTVEESLGSLRGCSASTLRFRFADLDLAMVLGANFQGLRGWYSGSLAVRRDPAAEILWILPTVVLLPTL
jgi:hypothetical protein